MKRLNRSLGYVVAVGSLLGSTTGLSRAEREEPKPAAIVTLGILGTFATGATFDTGSFAVTVSEGEKQTLRVAVKGPGHQDCWSLTPFVPVATLLRESLHVWEAQVTILKASFDRVELGLDWRRFEPGLGADTPAIAESRLVSLAEGDRQLLDLQPLPTGMPETCPFVNVALQLQAGLEEPAELRNRSIEYELWLVREGQAARRERQWRVTARHGEKRSFDFPPFALTVPGSHWPDDDSPIVVKTNVQGHVRGRCRADGRLDLVLSATRGFGVANNGGWGTGESGRKLMDVAPGEAIELQLPVTPLADVQKATPTRATMRDEDQVRSFLQTQKVSLILKATPVS